MEEGAMANTPLELYENAYQLQYYEKKIPDAIRIYEAIIRDFPDSNECGYAVIQLQKIKSRDITNALKAGATRGYPLLIVAFMASFFALLVALVGILLLFHQLRVEHHRTTLAISAIGKIYCGNEEGALKVLDEMKDFSRQDVLAFELSSDIFRKHNQSPQPPPLTPPPALPASPDTTHKAAVPPQEEMQVDDAAAGKKYAKALQQKPLAPKKAVAAPTPTLRQRPGKGKKGPLIVDPDSISYF
jgi:hypothetical protein